MALAKFMSTLVGRGVRVVAGLAMIGAGLFVVGDVAGIILAVVGVLPLAAGALNFCAISPLIGAPFWGKDAA